jgi:hypothetical protein
LRDLIGFFKVNDSGIPKHKTAVITKRAVMTKSFKQPKSIPSKNGGIDLNMNQHDGDYERF